jgi:predicted nucleic acid-binding Zn ribbon protein
MFEQSGGDRECPSCALPIDEDADACPYCGYDLPKQKNSLKIAAIVFALLMLWPLFELIQLLLG